jgi:hypothetical protein
LGTGVTVDGKGHGTLVGQASSQDSPCPTPPPPYRPGCGPLSLGSKQSALVDSDVFVARFASSDGAIEWIAVPGGSSWTYGGAAADGAGNAYLAGKGGGDGAPTFGSTTLPAGLFLARADATGSFTWATIGTAALRDGGLGGGSADAMIGGLTADRSGGLLAAGWFRGTLTLGATTLATTKPQNQNLFVWKVTPP